jgi:hypothetical protein
MKQKSNYNEVLRHENEITRLKIKAEFGVEVNEMEDLNPAVENIWLNHILEFERASKNNEKITVAELLGNPVFKPVNQIGEQEITGELVELMGFLKTKNVAINSVAGVDDREMYRFITEELVLKETESNMPKNMILCYIYEEFHPNHPYDIEKQAKEFINDLEKKDGNSVDYYLASGDGEVKKIEINNLRRRITLFKDAFDEIRIEEFRTKEITVQNEDTTAKLVFDYKIAALPPGSKTYHYLSGTGEMHFMNQYGWWGIETINMKGVV